MGPESWVVVGRRGPIGTRRLRIEVPAAPAAVALRHLATHVEDLAVPGELQEDSANSKVIEPLNSSLFGGSHEAIINTGSEGKRLDERVDTRDVDQNVRRV